MFHFRRTPRGQKRLIVSDTDHWIDHRQTTKETLAWFDNSKRLVAADR